MPLERQVVNVPFAKGLDTQPDPLQVEVGDLLVCENGIFETPKLIKKRNGYESLPRTVTTEADLAAGNVLQEFNGSLVLGNGTAAYSWGGASLDEWVPSGPMPAINSSSDSVHRDAFYQSSVSVAYSQAHDCLLYAWETVLSLAGARAISGAWVERSTGRVISVIPASAITADGLAPQVSYSSAEDRFYVVYYLAAAGAIKTLKVAPFASAFSAGPVIAAASFPVGTTAPVFSVATIGSRTYVFYPPTNASMAVKYIDTAGSLSAVVYAPAVTNAGYQSAIWGDSSNRVWLAFRSDVAGTLKFAIIDSGNSVVVAPTTFDTLQQIENIGGCMADANQACVLYQAAVDVKTAYVTASATFSVLPPFSSVTLQVGRPRLVSAPCSSGGSLYAVVYVQVSSSRIAGTAAILTWHMGETPVLAGAAYQGETWLPFVGSRQVAPLLDIGGELLWPALVIDRFIPPSDYSTGVEGLSLRLSGTIADKTKIARNAQFSGAALWEYDGTRVVESGFIHLPAPNFGGGVVTPGAGSITGGTYGYAFIYEWTDSAGGLHRSAPHLIESPLVLAANDKVTFTLPPLRFTNKPIGDVSIAPYRTISNGSVYFRLGTLPDTGGGTITLADTASDASILGNEQLYTTGGEVENIQPPAPYCLATYRSRMLLVPAEARGTVWYSKQVIPGWPLEFSDLFVLNVDSRGGDITALAAMDDKLIIFKRTASFYMVGDGPSPNGQNNDFSTPTLITTDTGAVDFRSVISTPLGIMYKSEKGIYLLDRALQAHFIGSQVTAFDAYDVTSANMSEDTREVRFTLSNGTALVYNYNFQAWSVFTNHSAVSSTTYQGKWAHLTSAGVVNVETPGSWLDNATAILRRIVTSWWAGAGVQGFQRVRRALLLFKPQSGSATTVNLGVAYDYDATIAQTAVAGTTLTGGSTAGAQVLVHLSRQKCEAVQLTVTETTSANEEGPRFSAIAMEVGAKKGHDKLPAARVAT